MFFQLIFGPKILKSNYTQLNEQLQLLTSAEWKGGLMNPNEHSTHFSAATFNLVFL